MTDLNLIEECRKGNMSSLRTLIEKTSPFAYSVAFRLLGNEEQAKEAVQDTMVIMWQKISRIRSAEAYKTWIYRIVVNKCYDELRKRKGNHEFSADEKTWKMISDTFTDNASPALENEETARIITLLTARLSPKQKTVFVLSELEEMTGDEISEITGMSKLLIKSNLHYARKNISEMLGKYL